MSKKKTLTKGRIPYTSRGAAPRRAGGNGKPIWFEGLSN